MMSLVVVAGAAMQLPAGRLSDMTDRRYVLAGAAVGAAAVRPAGVPGRSRARPGWSSCMTGGLRRARLHALFDRRGACQRPRQAGGFRQSVGRPAAALRLRHDDRPGARRGADGLDAAGKPVPGDGARAYRCSPPTRCCASAAARRCRSRRREAFKTLPSDRAVTPEALRLDPRTKPPTGEVATCKDQS